MCQSDPKLQSAKSPGLLKAVLGKPGKVPDALPGFCSKIGRHQRKSVPKYRSITHEYAPTFHRNAQPFVRTECDRIPPLHASKQNPPIPIPSTPPTPLPTHLPPTP